MRILGISNTYYQLIAFIQLKNTLFSNDSVDIILSDHSNGAKEIALELQKQKVFNEVYFLPTLKIKEENYGKLIKIKHIIEMVSGNSKLCNHLNNQYDQFIYYNLDIAVEIIFLIYMYIQIH